VVTPTAFVPLAAYVVEVIVVAVAVVVVILENVLVVTVVTGAPTDILPTRLPLLSVNQMEFVDGSNAMPVGALAIVGSAYSVMVRSVWSSLPILFAAFSVNHTKPALSTTTSNGLELLVNPVNCVKIWLTGSNRKIELHVLAVNQMMPVGSTVIPRGPHDAMGTSYRVICLVATDSFPSLFTLGSVNQTLPD